MKEQEEILADLEDFTHLLSKELDDIPEDLESTMDSQSVNTEQPTGHYDVGNSYRLEDLMSINSQDSLMQWNTSPISPEVGRHGSSQVEHDKEEEEMSDDSVPLSLI